MATFSADISNKPWGSVNKTTLGNAVAKAFTTGGITRAQIRQVYLYVPDDAFDKDADGKPTFLHSKAKLPVAEFSGGNITINRNGVHAAFGAVQGARGDLDIPDAEMPGIRSRLRSLYRKIKEDVPDALKDSLEQVAASRPIDELVKGSWDYAMNAIRMAFDAVFNPNSYERQWHIVETFNDFLVVVDWGARSELMPDEYYKVGYRVTAEGYEFDSRDTWEIIELTYQAQTDSSAIPAAEAATASAGEPAPPVTVPDAVGAMADSIEPDDRALDPDPDAPALARGKGDGRRFVEAVAGYAELVESSGNGDGPWKIRGIGNTADVVNGNKRRYPAEVLAAAVEQLREHLHESAGQGRYIDKPVMGETDHPIDKGHRRPLLTETVVNWKSVSFDGTHVLLEGLLLATAKGKDIRAQMQGGVKPGISQRGYGDSRMVKIGGEKIEEVTQLTITGYDFTNPGDQADHDSRVTFHEATQGEDAMTFEEFIAYLKDHPDVLDTVLVERVERAGDAAWAKMESQVRAALNIGPEADLGEALKQAGEARRTQLEEKRRQEIEATIAAATQDLPYGDKRNAAFVQSVRALAPVAPEAVAPIVAAQRKVFDELAATDEMRRMGMGAPRLGSGATGVHLRVLGPTIEAEDNLPAYLRPAVEFRESLIRAGQGFRRRDPSKPKTVNEEFADLVLAQFDKLFEKQLIAESRRFDEAETTADLSLPYSVSRVIAAEAIPQLIAVSVFDAGVVDQSPIRLYYERYVAETGATAIVTSEVVVGAHGAWVALANKQLQPGTVILTNAGATVTYAEGTDYVIDYLGGRLMTLAAGATTNGQSLRINYTYDAIRKGEMSSIERGKQTFTFKTLDMNPARLAMQLSSEVVTFSRSQLGWDATARTIASLISQVQRKIDKGLFYLALAAALQQANNSGGTWVEASDPISEMVDKIGVARVKVGNRFYEPTAILCSLTNGDKLANWTGFTQAGSRPDADLNAAGYAGRVKGLPVFHSVNFTDGHILVLNLEVVQYRIYQPMMLKGPFPSYSSDGELIAADQWYVEQYDGAEATVPEKASYIQVA